MNRIILQSGESPDQGNQGIVDWGTPQELFDGLDELHGPFELDAAASVVNHKCSMFYTEADDGLSQDWGGLNVFVNPPYGKKALGEWIEKGYSESTRPGTKVTMLIRASIERPCFWRWCFGIPPRYTSGPHRAIGDPARDLSVPTGTAKYIHPIDGRLKFVGPSTDGATFVALVVVFEYPGVWTPVVQYIDRHGRLLCPNFSKNSYASPGQ
uniref:Putative methyltransferase n=1 Tax=viral metagenome TaxID=1070528 RepID=A0A6M3LXK5_9ZZZZ